MLMMLAGLCFCRNVALLMLMMLAVVGCIMERVAADAQDACSNVLHLMLMMRAVLGLNLRLWFFGEKVG